jgi:hypothetical protein
MEGQKVDHDLNYSVHPGKVGLVVPRAGANGGRAQLLCEVAMTDPSAKLANYQSAVAKTFPLKAQQALRLIGAPPLELLALRRYIRKGEELNTQWVWDHQQIKAYEESPKATKVRAEIAKVKKKFEELNPGYTLATSPIRDLARQVRLWKGNHTVHAAGVSLREKCLKEVSLASYPDVPTEDDTKKFNRFLGHCAVHPEPTSAAPGLSDHGQMHAVDFIIMQGQKKIADTVSSNISAQWVLPGWEKKLTNAIKSSGSRFKGPLQHPHEPWHYSLPHHF